MPQLRRQDESRIGQDTHSAFVRAIVFGIGAAMLGMILYATFAIVTGIVIGYASLAVGWIVGKAMIQGSGGVGGRRYQIVAVLLTYAARLRPGQVPNRGFTTYPDGCKRTSSAACGRARNPSGWSCFAVSRFVDNPFGGLIGLLILLVGMSFAWRITAAEADESLVPSKTRRNRPLLSMGWYDRNT